MPVNSLPISIKSLLKGRSVEWERLEFKKGWNPQAVVHTLCAFANDFHNMGGGYIVVGVEERNGRPTLPPVGLSADRIDSIQKDILRLGNTAIKPAYHPRSVPVDYQGKTILVIWAPAGEGRPYRAKKSLSRGNNEWREYIRKQSSTVMARNSDLKELVSLTATVPFDDRYNQQATLADLSVRLIREFLEEVDSDLAMEVDQLSMERLGRQMNIVGGASETPAPKNIGLMMFNDHPENFFPVTQIDIVYFPNGPGADIFEEKEFKGPIWLILREALVFIKRNYLKETVIKRPDRAKADRVWNFPYAAIEEALVNAVYHRSYEIREPIEVRITSDELVVVSHPGPDRSLRIDDIAAGKAVSRRYRNRRIGEFLKELALTEGRSTGIGKIRQAIAQNGSPEAVFQTDEDRSSFVVCFPAHPSSVQIEGSHVEKEAQVKRPKRPKKEAQEAQENIPKRPEKEAQKAQKRGPSKEAKKAQERGPSKEAKKAQERGPSKKAQEKFLSWQIEIMKACRAVERSGRELLDAVGYSSRTGNFKKGMQQLLDEKLIEMTHPDQPNSRNQRYRLTPAGKRALKNVK